MGFEYSDDGLIEEDKFRDECGVFGIYSKEVDIVQAIFLGLHALQHRGQESAGIAVWDEGELRGYKGMGLVQQVFNEEVLKGLKGSMGIGHVRYSTCGSSRVENAQPFTKVYRDGNIALAHNGNFVNGESLRKELEEDGVIFESTVDSEVVIHLLDRLGVMDMRLGLIEVLKKVRGAYSMVFLAGEELIGVRDPGGFRPLCIGAIEDSYCIASESCAFDQIGAEYIREVEANEMVVINDSGLFSYSLEQDKKLSICVFELIYLSRPDSFVYHKSVYLIRKKMGELLARERRLDIDLVIPVPDSGIPAAIGYAKTLDIRYEMGLLRNHYIGRTFIEPTDYFRKTKIKMKLSPIAEVVKGKRIAIIDDSLVRGTTAREIVHLLKNVGAKEVHFLIASPIIYYPCFYGINTPSKKELLAWMYDGDLDRMKEYLNLDSLQYLSIKGLMEVINSERELCLACFNGEYPVPLTSELEMIARL